jgi:Cu/Ag efflux protein CusF
MKYIIACVLAFAFSNGQIAMAEMAMPQLQKSVMQSNSSKPNMTEGVVVKLDKANGTVELKHGALVNLGMPGMTMTFRVKDTAWLEKLKSGDRIHFIAEQADGALSIVELTVDK